LLAARNAPDTEPQDVTNPATASQKNLLEKREAKLRKTLPALVAALGLMALAVAPSLAQEWPTRGTIRMIVPYPAGGGTDVVARIVAKFLQERLKQTIIVDNRGGANGQIGLQALKQSAPDGYTMAMTSDSPMTVNKWVYSKIPYDPMKDFIHVTSVIRLPSLLAVHPSLPVKNVAELIKLAKEKPGSLNYASAGVGNFSHLEAELFAQKAGIKLTHVPYKGTGPSSLGLIAGEVQMSFNNVSTLWPYVKEKKLRALAVLEPKRMPDLPDVPAVAETIPGFDMAPWVGIILPAGVPKPIVERLTAEILAVMKDPEAVKLFTDQQLVVMTLPGAEFTALIKKDSDKWEKVVKEANIKMD
jgi:tripartite-type tricarboxylate transporter receptor subunit TctC